MTYQVIWAGLEPEIRETQDPMLGRCSSWDNRVILATTEVEFTSEKSQRTRRVKLKEGEMQTDNANITTEGAFTEPDMPVDSR